MSKHIFIAAFVLSLVGWSHAVAQTAKEFQARYGNPVEVYEIRPGILIYPKFDSDGWLIEARIQRAVALEQTVYLDTELPDADLTKILDELVPVAKRGKESNISGLINVVGQGGTCSKLYENASVTYYSKSGSCSSAVAVIVELKPSFYSSK